MDTRCSVPYGTTRPEIKMSAPHHKPRPEDRSLTRRELLRRSGMGFGMLGLRRGVLGRVSGRLLAGPAESDAGYDQPARAQPPHFPAKAKRVIHIFMNGGPSHVDTFDPKPALAKIRGQAAADRQPRDRTQDRAAFPSPFKFPEIRPERHRGQRTDFPHMAEHIDDIVRHPLDARGRAESRAVAAADELRRSAADPARAWVRGSPTASAPRTRTCPASSPCARAAIRFRNRRTGRSAFLPGVYQGTYIDTQHTEIEKLIENIRNNYTSLPEQRAAARSAAATQRTPRETPRRTTRNWKRASSRSNWPTACRWSDRCLRHHAGAASTSATCTATARRRGRFLIARRLLERGVRFVQVWHGARAALGQSRRHRSEPPPAGQANATRRSARCSRI